MATRPGDVWVNPAELDTRTKQELWAGMKALEPELAELLTTDTNVSELKQTFGATLRLSRTQAAQFVRAGRKLLEEKTA